MSTQRSITDASSTTDSNQQTVGSNNATLEPNRGAKSEDDLVDDDDDDDDDDGDYDEDPEYQNLARPLFEFIISRVSDFSKDGHAELMTFSDFKALWRDRLETMRLELANSHEGELFISDPPLQELEIEILNNADEMSCPCCFAYVDAHITVRAEQGITWDLFLKALKEHLYGQEVRSEDLRLSDRHCGMLIPRDWNYMEADEGVFYRGSSYGKMRIWMYCSDTAVPHDPRENKL